MLPVGRMLVGYSCLDSIFYAGIKFDHSALIYLLLVLKFEVESNILIYQHENKFN